LIRRCESHANLVGDTDFTWSAGQQWRHKPCREHTTTEHAVEQSLQTALPLLNLTHECICSLPYAPRWCSYIGRTPHKNICYLCYLATMLRCSNVPVRCDVVQTVLVPALKQCMCPKATIMQMLHANVSRIHKSVHMSAPTQTDMCSVLHTVHNHIPAVQQAIDATPIQAARQQTHNSY
jgi:hypothetical protein